MRVDWVDANCGSLPVVPFYFLTLSERHKLMGKNTGHSSRSGAVKERAQAKNPLTNRYVKIDTSTGRIVDQKKTPGPYKGVKDVTRKK